MVTGRLRLRLFSHDEMVLMPGEVAQILRHRVMMTFYLCGLIALIWLNWDSRNPALPLELHALPQVAGVLAGGLVPVLGLLLAARRARRGEDVVVSASRLFLCAAVLGFAAYNQLAVPLGVGAVPSVRPAVVDIAFNYVLAEIIGGIAVHFVVPPLLTELRRFAAAPPAVPLTNARPMSNAMPVAPVALTGMAVGTDPAEFQPAVKSQSAAGPLLPAGLRVAQVRVANRHFDATEVLLVQAEGTHVVLTTTRGRQILPGPFAAVVDQMPDGLGQQVSRSDWIATAAVRGVRREGRDMILLCRDGQQLRVATSRQARLRDWFCLFSEEPHQAAS